MPGQRTFICQGCGKPITIAGGENAMRKAEPGERAANARYHSNACKQKAYRKRMQENRLLEIKMRYEQTMREARARHRNTHLHL